ncbi:MAG: hypothetical protein ACRCVW_02515 [Brevinema sp.]
MERKVKGALDGINGNAFMLMGYFQKLARQQGFSKEWIKQVLDEARSKDYNYLVATLLLHMEENDNG